MKKGPIDFIKYPTEKTLLIFFLVWFVSGGLLLAVGTDLFTKEISLAASQKAQLIGVTSATIGIFTRYFHNKNLKAEVNSEGSKT